VAGDVAVRAWVTEALQASGAEMQRHQQTLTGLQAVLVSLQAGGNAPGGAGASTEVYSAVLQQQQQAIGALQQALAEMQAASQTQPPDMLQERLGVLEGAVSEMRSMVGLMQRRERSAIGQAVAAALETRGADVRRLAEKVASLATERALVQPEAATQLAAQLGAPEAALKQYEAEWSEAKSLEQKVFERLVRRMELMVAADVRAAQAELEAYFGEMWPRRAQRRPLREASRVAHAG
jgi:hypothetical protein